MTSFKSYHPIWALSLSLIVVFQMSCTGKTNSIDRQTGADSAQGIVSDSSQTKSAEVVTIYSPSMKKDINALVVLPQNYDESTGDYPVVYLLHGFSDNYNTYYEKIPALADLANQHQLLIVCPDGGYSSWYFDSPIDPAYQYETHVTQEVVAYIDSAYRTKVSPAGRAITGHSMGGHGALYLAISHPEVYGAAGSMSGGVDLTYATTAWDIPKRLGSYSQNKQRWHDHSVIDMANQLVGRQMPLIIDCGLKDFFYQKNVNLHQKLLKLNIAHDYIERPGKHSWDYWANAVHYQMLFFSRFFEAGQ